MKTKPFILTLLLASVLTLSSSGQIGNMIRNKASQAVSNIGKAVKKETQKEADSLAQAKAEEAVSRKTGETGENREQKGFNLGNLISNKVDIKYEPSYVFNNSIYMQAEIYNDKEVMKMDYYIYYNDNNSNGGFESKMNVETDEGSGAVKTSIVYDNSNKCMLMLLDMGEGKFGMISAVPEDQAGTQTTEATTPATRGEFTKTGNSRVIAGYRCDEYLYREPDVKGYTKMWITRDLKVNADRRTMSRSGLPAYYANNAFLDGATLAMESFDEKDVPTMKMETKEIKKNISHTIAASGYPLRQVNLNQMQAQQPKK